LVEGGIEWTYGKLRVSIHQTADAAGAAAAKVVAAAIKKQVERRGVGAVLLATGNSQLRLLSHLSRNRSVPWDRVHVLHLDEYVGLSELHPSSFRQYLRRHLVDTVRPLAFHELRGDAENLDREAARYAALIDELQPGVCAMGIGENGHLAFNDPPAAFTAETLVAVVTLDERSRLQQVVEGHFSSVAEVPTRALTLTIPSLLMPATVVVTVPGIRKAAAVREALEGPIEGSCPASVLRQAGHARLFLDTDAASMLRPSS
jgi:glucosamine-6-phosphate deaminase